MIIYGLLAEQKMILIGVYVPHVAQKHFWSNLIKRIDLSWSKEIPMLGDFNGVMYSEPDRSRSISALSVSKAFQRWLKEN